VQGVIVPDIASQTLIFFVISVIVITAQRMDVRNMNLKTISFVKPVQKLFTDPWKVYNITGFSVMDQSLRTEIIKTI